MFSLVPGILCLFRMLTTMPESVMPAISMSCRSSAIPNRSWKADLSACTPAPPEWISVPSMSKSRRRFARAVIPSEVACLAVALWEGWEGSRCITFEFATGLLALKALAHASAAPRSCSREIRTAQFPTQQTLPCQTGRSPVCEAGMEKHW